LSGRTSKGGENLGQAGAGFKDNCVRLLSFVNFPLCIIHTCGSAGLALAVRWGLFYIFYDSVLSFLFFYFNIPVRWIQGRGSNLGGIVGLAYA